MIVFLRQAVINRMPTPQQGATPYAVTVAA